MNCFEYRDRVLHAEGVTLPAIADAIGTPCYVYSAAAIAGQYRRLSAGLAGLDHLICYALKANSNQAVLKLLADLGCGFDAVSGGEIARALAAGAPGERIVFSGVGKTGGEMRDALLCGVRHFNVESEPELELLAQVASSLGRTAPVAIRVNPDVDARTHRKISTGRSENKFGIPIARARDVYRSAMGMPGISIIGLDVHIGSQLTSLAPFEQAYRKAAELVTALRAESVPIDRVDLGGGLGVSYGDDQPQPPTIEQYCELVHRIFGGLGCQVEIEPGRLIVGNAGLLLTSVLYVKQGQDRQFLVVDAAMNDLLRPAMYDAHHDILPVRRETSPEMNHMDVVGPVCESSDTFAVQRQLPKPGPGDLVAFGTAGAYCAVMASEYNSRPLVPEVLVAGDRFAVIRARAGIDSIIGRDQIPDWL